MVFYNKINVKIFEQFLTGATRRQRRDIDHKMLKAIVAAGGLYKSFQLVSKMEDLLTKYIIRG